MNVDLPVEGSAAIVRVENGQPQLVARVLPTERGPLAQALIAKRYCHPEEERS